MCIRDRPKGKGKLQFEADKTVRKVGDTLASGIHGKIHEVEQENTAVEAAHKTEIAAETAARHFSHQMCIRDRRQVILSHIEEHSKKPDEARERIVRLMGDLPRVELFARQSPEGWDV